VKRQAQCLTPFQRKLLDKALQTDLKAEYRQRIEIMLRTDAGQTQKQICQDLKCTRETARCWMLMAQTGQAHRWAESPPGRPKTINDEYLRQLQELVNHSPRDYGYAFQRWTCSSLSQHLARQLGIKISSRHVNRLLKGMGCSTNGSTTVLADQPTIKIQDLPASPPNSMNPFCLIYQICR
jgi:transposase